jgi:hypothetical protein
MCHSQFVLLLMIMDPRLEFLLNVLADQELRIVVPLSQKTASSSDEKGQNTTTEETVW